MKNCSVGILIVWALAAGHPAAETPASRMLDRLSELAGEWEGTYQWTGAREDSGPLQATYSVTGNGSAVVEHLVMNGIPSMTTVYHLDREDLRMTHYCAARNQPRLKASRIDHEGGVAEFAFVDVTNLSSAQAGYVEHFEIRLVRSDHIVLRFVFGRGERRAIETISLRRSGRGALGSRGRATDRGLARTGILHDRSRR